MSGRWTAGGHGREKEGDGSGIPTDNHRVSWSHIFLQHCHDVFWENCSWNWGRDDSGCFHYILK